MKTNYFITLILCLICSVLCAQNVERVEIEGRVVVDRNDLEGITVYNSSSNKGTVTDKEGGFTIKVALNDRLQFAALQFENFEVNITQDVLDSKILTVFLVEQVNKLDEVIILPHDLSGNLAIDTKSVALFNPNLDALYFGLANLDKMEFENQHLEVVENTALQTNVIKYQTDFVKIIAAILKPITTSKSKKIKKELKPKQAILDLYTMAYLKELLSIQDKDIVEFLYFVEDNNFDLSLLNPEKEFEFLKYLKSQEQKFALIKYAEN